MKKWKNKERKEWKIKFMNKYLKNEEIKERMHERIYVALFNFALRGYIGARGSPKVIYLTRLKKRFLLLKFLVQFVILYHNMKRRKCRVVRSLVRTFVCPHTRCLARPSLR